MLYLARWHEVEEAPGLWDIRPEGDLGDYAALDLRGSDDAQAGEIDGAVPWCLLWTPDTQVEIPGRLIKVGDHPDDVSVTARNALANRLGWNPARTGRTLGELAFDFYQEEGDDLVGGRPNRLGPSKKHDRQTKRLGINLGPYVLATELPPSELSAAVGTVSDDFNRANSTGLGSNWSRATGTSTIDIVSNQAEKLTGETTTYYVYTADTCNDDAQIGHITAVNNITSGQIGVNVRCLNAATDSSSYMGYFAPPEGSGGAGRIRYNTTAGARTTLTSYINCGLTVPVDITIEIDGSTLELFLDGTSKGTHTDTSNGGSAQYPGASTRRSGGLWLYPNTQQADNFMFGDLVQEITATAISSTVSIGSPTVERAGQVIAAPADLGRGSVRITS